MSNIKLFSPSGDRGLKVVIIGGGFGGLKLARELNNKAGFEVYLLDKYNYHQFQPLFYQVATASLDPSNISFPLRKVFHKSNNVHFRMAEVKEIISVENKVLTDIGGNYIYLKGILQSQPCYLIHGQVSIRQNHHR